MTITVKKLVIILGIIFALILCANYVITTSIKNIKRGEVISENDSVIVENDLKEKNKTNKPIKMRPWKESSPEELAKLKKFGIKIRPRNYGPSKPDQWNEYVGKRIAEGKIFESEAAKEVIKMIHVNEKEYREIMAVNKEHEEAVKTLLSEEPLNKDHKERLQNIYQLQAVGNVLKNRVVTKNNALVAGKISSSIEQEDLLP